MILEDDPYHKMYHRIGYSYEYPEPPKADFIDQLIKNLPPKQMLAGFDLKEALRCFRKMSRSPSPVFLSQSQIVTDKRETSTPTVEAKKGNILNYVGILLYTIINSY